MLPDLLLRDGATSMGRECLLIRRRRRRLLLHLLVAVCFLGLGRIGIRTEDQQQQAAML